MLQRMHGEDEFERSQIELWQHKIFRRARGPQKQFPINKILLGDHHDQYHYFIFHCIKWEIKKKYIFCLFSKSAGFKGINKTIMRKYFLVLIFWVSSSYSCLWKFWCFFCRKLARKWKKRNQGIYFVYLRIMFYSILKWIKRLL